MDKGTIKIYSGDGRGKSPAALGSAVQAASEGKKVIIIQFLKGKGLGDTPFLRRLEPEIRVFHFEKSEESFEELSEDRRREEIANIQNGLHYAKKVLSIHECDLLILDEIFGLVEKDIISVEDLKEILELRDDADVIMTGINLPDDLCVVADEVSKIETVHFKVFDN